MDERRAGLMAAAGEVQRVVVRELAVGSMTAAEKEAELEYILAAVSAVGQAESHDRTAEAYGRAEVLGP